MLEENEKIKKGAAKLEGISAGPVTEDNLFCWNASIFGPEGTIWEGNNYNLELLTLLQGGIYNFELVYDDSDAPPRVRFLTQMWHPHSKPTCGTIYDEPSH